VPTFRLSDASCRSSPARGNIRERLTSCLCRVEQDDDLYQPTANLSTHRDGVCTIRTRILLRCYAGVPRGMSVSEPRRVDVHSPQPLWEVYAKAKKANLRPDPTAVEAARAKVDWRHVGSPAGRNSVAASGHSRDAQWAIAQGLPSDRCVEALQAHTGIEQRAGQYVRSRRWATIRTASLGQWNSASPTKRRVPGDLPLSTAAGDLR